MLRSVVVVTRVTGGSVMVKLLDTVVVWLKKCVAGKAVSTRHA